MNEYDYMRNQFAQYNMNNMFPNQMFNRNFGQNLLNTNKIFVNGLNDAISKPLPPNSDYIFVDNNEAIIYRKVVDAQGKTDIKAYDIVLKDEQKTNNFVERSEFESLQKELNSLKELLSNNVKGDDADGK